MTTYMGMSLKRSEDPQLITGQGAYLDDLSVPGMAHAVVLRSPHAHARILSIDASAALAMPGVVAVVTADDLGEINPKVGVHTEEEGMEVSAPAHPVLARGKVRYVGEPVAVVVADDRYTARDALEAVRVDYQPLPAVVDPYMALKDEVVLHQELGTNLVLTMKVDHGDMEDAMRRAHKVVHTQFKSQRISAAPMEGRGSLASYDRSTDILTVWSSTNAPYMQQRGIALALKREPSSIRVIAPEVGGSFGSKGSVGGDLAVMCYLPIKLGRPIKWVEDRSEYMTYYHARDMDIDVEAAVASDGTILGLRFDSVCDIGAYFVQSTIVPVAHMVHRLPGPYKTPVVRVLVRGVATNKPTTGPYRGAGGPESAYFMERTMDSIAAELGMDPVELRKRNLIPPEEMPYTTPTGLNYDTGDYPALLERLLELSDYQELRREQAAARAQGRLVGVGVATFVKAVGGGGIFLRSTARVEIEPEGHVNVYTEASPHGQGTETTFAQVAADTLGVRPENVSVLHSDTSMLEYGHGTFASRAVIVAGGAVYEALQEGRHKMSAIAADLLGCPAEEVEFADGRVRAQGQEASFAEVASRAYREETLPQGLTPGLEFCGDFTLPDYGYPYGGLIVLAEVDQETGEIKLLRCIGVHDCGTIINPMLVEGQIHGGLAQGIGQAITENITYTSDGQPIGSTFLEYGMPLAEDTPESLLFDTTNTPSKANPMGAKGVAEVSTVGSPAAVANAVLDALSPLGVTHLDTPMTPDRVWHALNS